MWHQSLLNERNLTNNDHIVCVSREKRRQVIKQNLFYLHSNVLITSRFWENGWKNSKKINVLMFQCCDLFIFFLTSTKVHFYVLKKKPTLNFRQDPERAIGIPNQCLPGYFLFFFFFSPNPSMALLMLTSLAAHLEQPGAIALLQRASVYCRSQDIALFWQKMPCNEGEA